MFLFPFQKRLALPTSGGREKAPPHRRAERGAEADPAEVWAGEARSGRRRGRLTSRWRRRYGSFGEQSLGLEII